MKLGEELRDLDVKVVEFGVSGEIGGRRWNRACVLNSLEWDLYRLDNSSRFLKLGECVGAC